MIFKNSSEYGSEEFLNTLTPAERNALLNGMNNDFINNCTDYSDYCNEYFLSVMLDVEKKLGAPPIFETYEKSFNIIYEKIKSKYNGILNDTELQGFIIPYLLGLCETNYLNSSEREYWKEIIFSVEKKSTNTAPLQIMYAKTCLGYGSVYDIEPKNSEICILLPEYDNSSKDPCNSLDFFSSAKFCNRTLSYEQTHFAEEILSEEYANNLQRDCQKNLRFIFFGNFD